MQRMRKSVRTSAKAPPRRNRLQLPVPAEEFSESSVICQVSGYDVVILNIGTTPIEAGIGVAWSVRFARMEGIHVLDSGLAPGAVHVLTGALGSSYLSTRTRCDAKFAETDVQGAANGPP